MRLSSPRGRGFDEPTLLGDPFICCQDRLSCMMILGIVDYLMKKFD